MNETDNLKRLNEFCRNSLVEHLGIEYTAMGEGWIEAREYGFGGDDRRGYQCNHLARESGI